jgi:hypothetical protein
MSLPRCLSPRSSRFAAAGLFAVSIAASWALGTHAALALDHPPTEAAAGPWDLVQADGSRKCRLTLRVDSARRGENPLGMPAGCRKAFPVLESAGGWMLTADQQLALADPAGKVILSFAPAEEQRMVAKGPRGETYEMSQIGEAKLRMAQAAPAATAIAAPSPIQPSSTPGLRRAQAPLAAAPARPTAAAAELPTTSPVVAFPGRPADFAGRYIILREGDKDVGCLLSLDTAARGPRGSYKAQLAPACRDQGIVVFDPIGWQLERGRLLLTARKGHNAVFEYHANGVWWKDPKEGGKPLGLKKL